MNFDLQDRHVRQVHRSIDLSAAAPFDGAHHAVMKRVDCVEEAGEVFRRCRKHLPPGQM